MNKYLLVSVLTALALPAYADVESFVNAAKGSDVAKIQEFLQAGENVNAKNELGNTALHYAAASGNSDMVKFLLENGADANIANDKGWTPLAIAEKKKFGDIVNMFQSAQNNKDLSDLVAKASENAKVVEQKVGDVKEKTLAKAQEIKENTSAKVENIKKETVNNVQAKKAEVKENVADKIAEVKENVTSAKQETAQKVEAAKEVAQNKIAEAEKSVEKTVSTTAENVKSAENKVETKAKEVVATAVAPVAQESAKTEVKAEPKEDVKTESKAEVKAEEPKAEPKTETKAEAKPATKPAPKAEAKPATKSAPRRLIKPVVAKPAPKFLASNINKAIYAGDEEIVYCLYYLGLQTDQHNLSLASEFFAGTTIINKARFDYISDLALKYYDNASTAEMQNMANTCAKIITPKNRDKQNQIIRAMNKAIGY